MQRLRRSRGFTIVELLVVIVILAILSTLVFVAYDKAQMQARDSKLRDAADKVADAVQLFASNTGHFPAGGMSSTTAIGAAKECVDGFNGYFDKGLYTCTVEDTLVASGYLPGNFSVGLPNNTIFGPGRGIMVYDMKYLTGTSTGKGMVFFALESVSAADTAKFNSEMTKCGINIAGSVIQRDSYGMRSGICFQFS